MTQATAAAPDVKKPMTLLEISQLGYNQKTREVFTGATLTVQTLSLSRQQKILSNIPAEATDPIVRYTHLQIETLANATLAINDEKYSEADVNRLREFYSGLQSRVLQSFYEVYQEMMDEQDKTLLGLKKT
jgi:uncharacterized protein YjiK